MACNTGLLTGLVVTVNLALGTSVFLLGVAMALNGSFWGALGAVPVMAAAAVFGAVVAGSLIAMRIEISKNCMKCASQAERLLRFVEELIGVTSAYTIGLAATLLTAWIPWAGLIGMGIAMVMLVALIPNMEKLPGFFFAIGDCDVAVTSAQRVVVVLSTVALYIAVVIFVLELRQIPAGEAPSNFLCLGASCGR